MSATRFKDPSHPACLAALKPERLRDKPTIVWDGWREKILAPALPSDLLAGFLEQEAEAKAVQAQIRQLIKLNQIEERSETEFSFTHGTQIKSLRLKNEHRNALVKGQLAIVTLDKGYAIVPAAVSDKIIQRDETVMVLRNSSSDDAQADDEYADYEVPDDLMW